MKLEPNRGRRRALLALAAAPIAFHGSRASAQSTWTKPIRLVVPNPAGGGTDVAARIIGQRVSERLGQPVVVDNRPGAGGVVAAEVVAKSPADGYTLLYATAGFAAIPALVANVPYDTLKDFVPVSLTLRGNSIIVVSPSLPIHTLAELIAYSKQKPDALNCGSPSAAVTLAYEYFKSLTGARLTVVPYRGSVQAFTDFVGGQVQVLLDPAISMLPQVKSGKARALAVTGERRDAAAPDVPTVAESGYPTFTLPSWHGVFAPAGSPKPVIDRLQAEFVHAVAAPDIKEKLQQIGVEPLGQPAAELGRLLEREVQLWTAIGRQSGIKPA